MTCGKLYNAELIRSVNEAEKVITMNLSNTMSKMTGLGMQHAGAILVSVAAWVSTAAYAVNDLPGGPAVNQLNLHPAASKIAAEQIQLAFKNGAGESCRSRWTLEASQ